jgi:hypothetical protein
MCLLRVDQLILVTDKSFHFYLAIRLHCDRVLWVLNCYDAVIPENPGTTPILGKFNGGLPVVCFP